MADVRHYDDDDGQRHIICSRQVVGDHELQRAEHAEVLEYLVRKVRRDLVAHLATKGLVPRESVRWTLMAEVLAVPHGSD